MREWLQSMPYQRGVSWPTAGPAAIHAEAAMAKAHEVLFIMECSPLAFYRAPLGSVTCYGRRRTQVRSFQVRYVRGTALNAISDYGVGEGDAPQAGPGQVQIKVAACGIGYVDVLVALGGYQVKPTLPHTPGQEIAGTVSAVGSVARAFRSATVSWRRRRAASPSTP